MASIMGGDWAGRQLAFPKSDKLRPSAGRVKEAIFSIITSIVWKRSGTPSFSEIQCLDLFAGIGALGLEALSRGARHAVFVEKERHHAKFLQENIESLNCEDQCTLMIAPFESGQWVSKGPFDLVFADPPYAFPKLDSILSALAEPGILKNDAIIILERDPKRSVVMPSSFSLHSTRQLGPAGIDVFLANNPK